MKLGCFMVVRSSFSFLFIVRISPFIIFLELILNVFLRHYLQYSSELQPKLSVGMSTLEIVSDFIPSLIPNILEEGKCLKALALPCFY
jgi:hypothetical protein